MKAGIDLGTSHSLIAKLAPNGDTELVPDMMFKNRLSTPSSIHLANKKALIGWQALQQYEQNPNHTLLYNFFKQDMGIEKPILFDDMGNPWYPEGLSALLLKKLKNDYESFSGQFMDGAVITVPAHFNDNQRRAVIYAANLADIELLALLDEPIAAAIHYGFSEMKEKEKVLFVYDFGGGTFDATILTINNKGIYVLSKDGDTKLGGKDIDNKIKELLLPQISDKFNIEKWNTFNWIQFQKISEEFKIELSTLQNRFLTKEFSIGQSLFTTMLSMTQFEKSIEDILVKTIECSKRCIQQSGLQIKDIDEFIMVGGSSQLPYVHQYFCSAMGVDAQKVKSHQPLFAVAQGAAIYAAQIAGENTGVFSLPPEFKGVSGHYMGIKTFDPKTKEIKVDLLIPKNQPLPLKAVKTYFTSNDQQDKILLEIVQFTDRDGPYAPVGKVLIGPIAKPQINYPIEVVLELGTNGCVTVKTIDPNSRTEVSNSFSPEVSFNTNMIQQKQLIRQTLINGVG